MKKDLRKKQCKTESHVVIPTRRTSNKTAFTLAEVLITLGIVGVVAALTIPTLIQNYKEKVVVNKLKQAYTLLDQVLKNAEVDNGSYLNWNYELSTTDFTKTYILPYVKYSKTCKTNGGCFKPVYNGKDGWVLIDNSSQFFISPDAYQKLLLFNGMSLAVRLEENYQNMVHFVVDINGPLKGNSRLGEDIFLFMLHTGKKVSGWSNNQRYLIPGSQCRDGLGHINYTVEGLLNDTSCAGGCNLNAVFANGKQRGEACSAVIIKNGWKIPDNYPIKF